MIGKTNQNLKEWAGKVEEWERKYGKSGNNGKLAFDLTRIMVVRRCVKCNSVRVKMSRHHKGHEFLFACLLEERYAARYIQFHPDDVDWLCNRCHVRAHVIYQPILKKLWFYVDLQESKGLPLKFEILETFRTALIRRYEHWIKYKKKKRKKKNARSMRK